MKLKAWLVLLILAVGALVAAVAAAPFVTFHDLIEAGRAGDRDRLERLVDFPAVRDSLKDQLLARMQRSVGRGPLGGLAALIGPGVVGQLVDVAVTPDGIAAIVRSGRAPLAETRPGKTALPPPPETAPPPETPDQAPAPKKLRTRFAYTGLNSFAATTVTRDLGEAPITWVLRREGVFSWKLAAIELPASYRPPSTGEG